MDRCDEELYNVDIQLAENEELNNEQSLNDTEAISIRRRELLAKTKIVKQTWSIVEIFQKIDSGKLVLDPKYQRNVIWQPDKKTAFIESLFMGITIPPVYVVEIPGKNMLEQNKYEVVDGKQRLSTINSFITNDLRLHEKKLDYFKDMFSNKNFSEIQAEYEEETNEMLSSVLDVYVITANSPEFTKYDIFARLNQGAEKLKVNEIRKAIYRSDELIKIEKYIKDNEENERYQQIFSKNDIARYEDYGRFFRSIAYYNNIDLENKIIKNYNSRPREMINDVLSNLQERKLEISTDIIDQILEQTINLLLILKENIYKEYLVDACIYFAINFKEQFNEKLEEILIDEDILKTFIKSPATTSNVNCRIKKICEILGI